AARRHGGRDGPRRGEAIAASRISPDDRQRQGARRMSVAQPRLLRIGGAPGNRPGRRDRRQGHRRHLHGDFAQRRQGPLVRRVSRPVGALNDNRETFLSDDLTFTSYTSPIKRVSGRAAYLDATKRFYSMIGSMEVRDLLVDGVKACALTRYELRPPAGPPFSSDVAEVFEVRDGKIVSFDI